MTYSRPLQILVDEHKVILAVLDALEERASASRDAEFPQQFFEHACDFLATFADRCHHAKEEGQLFPLLAQRGLPVERGPIACMLNEHTQGRGHVAAMRAALERTAHGDAGARETVFAEAQAYVSLLRGHIQKENHVLFVLADGCLSDEDKTALCAQFAQAEHASLPPGTHERCLALAAELTGAGVPM